MSPPDRDWLASPVQETSAVWGEDSELPMYVLVIIRQSVIFRMIPATVQQGNPASAVAIRARCPSTPVHADRYTGPRLCCTAVGGSAPRSSHRCATGPLVRRRAGRRAMLELSGAPGRVELAGAGFDCRRVVPAPPASSRPSSVGRLTATPRTAAGSQTQRPGSVQRPRLWDDDAMTGLSNRSRVSTERVRGSNMRSPDWKPPDKLRVPESWLLGYHPDRDDTEDHTGESSPDNET